MSDCHDMPVDVSALPAPLTPPDCDLRDFADMPVEVARLRDSDLVSDESPEVCWAAFLLWGAAWHQVPAASIPDNDRWMAKAAGYVSRGKVDPHWNEIRDGVMRKWVKCHDGRLYHPVVAEKALASWGKRLRYHYERAKDRLRQHNRAGKAEHKDAWVEIKPLTFEQWNEQRIATGIPVERCDAVPGLPAERRFIPAETPREVAERVLGSRGAHTEQATDPPEPGEEPQEFQRSTQGIPSESVPKGREGIGRERKGEEEEKEKEISPKPPKGVGTVHEFPPGFDRFWAAYPRKVGKDAAARAFAKRKPDAAMVDAMVAAIEAQKRTEQWRRDGGQFIPHPSTWLNEGRWMDEVGVSVAAGVATDLDAIFARGAS